MIKGISNLKWIGVGGQKCGLYNIVSIVSTFQLDVYFWYQYNFCGSLLYVIGILLFTFGIMIQNFVSSESINTDLYTESIIKGFLTLI